MVQYGTLYMNDAPIDKHSSLFSFMGLYTGDRCFVVKKKLAVRQQERESKRLLT